MTDALVDILVHPQIFDVLIVVAMEISIAASLDHVILGQVVALSVLTILRGTSVSYVNWDTLAMLLIRIVSFVIVTLVLSIHSVTRAVGSAHAEKE